MSSTWHDRSKNLRPASAPYQAAAALAGNDVYLQSYTVSRAEYLEHGSGICRRKFGGPSYNINPPGFSRSGGGDEDIDEEEQELRYAMGLDNIKGRGRKRGGEEQEVTSGNWGGRRRRAQEGGLLGGVRL